MSEPPICIDNIGLGPERVPTGVPAQGVFEFEVGHGVTSGIVVENSVEPYGFFGDYGCANEQFGLEGAGSADTHHR
jgi:hypothetical protein